jgi:hypothetical protein
MPKQPHSDIPLSPFLTSQQRQPQTANTTDIFYILRGKSFSNAFKVRVKDDQHITDLKDLIKEKRKCVSGGYQCHMFDPLQPFYPQGGLSCA